jgi:hypothetical protein
MSFEEPDPLPRAAVERAIVAMEAGSTFRRAYEQLLLEVDDDAADRSMQLQREARGTWMLCLRTPASGARAKALVIGNALSGSSVPLAQHGFEVTLLDRSPLRLRFAELRNAELAPAGPTRVVAAHGETRLPFGEREFDLVVQEDGLPDESRGWRHDLDELRRVCAGELLFIADNRFAYKRSTGRRGVFEVPTPVEYASSILTRRSERTLAGYRALARQREFASPRAFALYPHAREFTFLVDLDHGWPRLELGPKERRNRWKIAAESLGLFSFLAPSFALLSARRELAERPARVERVLDELARATGEPRPRVEHMVATRGNSAVLLTRASDADEAGAWCVHVGLSGAQRDQLRRHFEMLTELTRRFPACPVPQPLAQLEIEGLHVTCERRARGWTAPQHTGRLDVTRTTLADLAGMLASLQVEPPRPMHEAEFERCIGRRFEIVERTVHTESARAHLARMRDDARKSLLGLSIPRVIFHADLRSKHVQALPGGRVTAILDWGSGEWSDLPYFDLLHFVAHERKQADGLDAAGMWRLIRERSGLHEFERAALESYAGQLELPELYCRTIEAIYPVFVAAMAETHWDYSRPRWLERQFEIGG